jgi:hypothetical protein
MSPYGSAQVFPLNGRILVTLCGLPLAVMITQPRRRFTTRDLGRPAATLRAAVSLSQYDTPSTVCVPAGPVYGYS